MQSYNKDIYTSQHININMCILNVDRCIQTALQRGDINLYSHHQLYVSPCSPPNTSFSWKTIQGFGTSKCTLGSDSGPCMVSCKTSLFCRSPNAYQSKTDRMKKQREWVTQTNWLVPPRGFWVPPNLWTTHFVRIIVCVCAFGVGGGERKPQLSDCQNGLWLLAK